MPRIRCFFDGCIYLERGYCTTEEIILDPDEGCLTFTQIDDLARDDDDWEDELFDTQEEGFSKQEDDDDDGYDPAEWN